MYIYKTFLLPFLMLHTVLPYLAPFLFAGIGWLIAQIFISFYLSAILKKRTQISQAIGDYAARQFSLDSIEQTATEPATIEKILPFAEEHIDNFLRVKLPAAMPMLAMFISDKLVADMKAIFMKELQELFPAIIRQYFANVKKNISVSDMISTKLNGISANTLKPILLKPMQIVYYSCALTGFVCGCIYIFLTLPA